jgi:hypothetical protein
MLLLRAKEIKYITGYSETHCRRFMKRIKEKYNIEHKEAAIPITAFCKFFSLEEEQVFRRLKGKNA